MQVRPGEHVLANAVLAVIDPPKASTSTDASARPDPTPPDGPEPFYRVDVAFDERVRTGESIPVTLTFANAGSTTVQVPVELTVEAERDDDAECEPVA